MKDYDDLIYKYPSLYSYCKCFECAIGWYDLIDELSNKLEKLIVEMNLPEEEACKASQVKEKYGTLRFYMTTLTDEMGDLIEKAENKSAEICEICGNKASDKYKEKSTWIFTKCDECWQKK